MPTSIGGFAISAPGFVLERVAMTRSQTTRLREAEAAPIDDTKVIDARFKVIGRKRRFARMLWRGLVTILWAALIGFMIPPAWMAFDYLRDFFR
jgi:hypothetical protein